MEDLIILEVENLDNYPAYIDEQNKYWREVMIEYGECNIPFIWIFALIDKKVVGRAHFTKIYHAPYAINDKQWWVGNLRVHDDYQRKGIAQKIISTGIENLRAKGMETLSCGIETDNTASINLFKKLLFKISDNQEYPNRMNVRGLGETKIYKRIL